MQEWKGGANYSEAYTRVLFRGGGGGKNVDAVLPRERKFKFHGTRRGREREKESTVRWKCYLGK